jgi:hypothetical protein
VQFAPLHVDAVKVGNLQLAAAEGSRVLIGVSTAAQKILQY